MARLFAALLAMAAVLAVLAAPMRGGRVHAIDDLGTYHLPLRAFYAEALQAGDDPAWCPRLFCGIDLHAEGQVGMLHPLHRALYRGLPLTTAFNLEVLSGYAVAMGGMFCFLGRRGLGADASAFGGLCFGASGFHLLHLMHPNFVGITAQLPWQLLMLDVLIRSENLRASGWAALAVAGLTASQVLLGYPQATWLSSLAEGGYALAVAFESGKGRRLAGAFGAKALGVLIGAAQLVPTAEALRLSSRTDPSAGFLAHGSLHPANVAQILNPYLFVDRFYTSGSPRAIAMHEMGIYAGALVPVFAAWLFVAIRRRDRADLPMLRLAAGATILGLVGLVLAFGQHGPLWGIVTSLPLIGVFRISARSTVLVHSAAAVLAASAFGDLCGRVGRSDRIAWRALWPLLIPPLASLAFVGGARLLADRQPDLGLMPFLAPIGIALIGPALSLGAAALVALAARGVGVATIGIVLFAAADQVGYGWEVLRREPTVTLAALRASRPVPPGPAGRRIMVGEGDNLWTLNGVTLVEGYVGLPPARRLHYWDRESLRLAGATWIREAGAFSEWTPLPGPLPRARLLAEAVHRPLVTQALKPGQLEAIAFLPEPVRLPEGEPGLAKIVEDRPGRIRVATSALGRRVLIVAERHHEGWAARIDGEPRPILRADGDFLGVVVEGGRHMVALRFEPRSHRIGARLSVVGLMIAGLVAIGLIGWPRR